MHLKILHQYKLVVIISLVLCFLELAPVKADELPEAERDLVVSLLRRSHEVFQKPMGFSLSQNVHEEPESKATLLAEARESFPTPSILREVQFNTITSGSDFTYTEYAVNYPEGIEDPRAGESYTIFLRWHEGKTRRYQEDGKKNTKKSSMVISTTKPLELNIGYTPKRIYEGLYEFMGPLSISWSPKTVVTKETNSNGEALYKLELELSGGRVETHWIRSDLETAYPVKGRVYRPGRLEGSYEVLGTERKDIHGQTLEYPTKIKWECATSTGYHMWLTEIKGTSEVKDFSPEDYDFTVMNGISIEDRILNMYYKSGEVGNEEDREYMKEFLQLSVTESLPVVKNENSGIDANEAQPLKQEVERASRINIPLILLGVLFTGSLLYIILRQLLSRKKIGSAEREKNEKN